MGPAGVFDVLMLMLREGLSASVEGQETLMQFARECEFQDTETAVMLFDVDALLYNRGRSRRMTIAWPLGGYLISRC
jgi:hypothetical protein